MLFRLNRLTRAPGEVKKYSHSRVFIESASGRRLECRRRPDAPPTRPGRAAMYRVRVYFSTHEARRGRRSVRREGPRGRGGPAGGNRTRPRARGREPTPLALPAGLAALPTRPFVEIYRPTY